MEKLITKKKKKTFKGRTVAISVLFAFLAIYSLALLSMYFWGFFTSLKSIPQFRSNVYGLPKGLPWKWEWANYGWAYKNMSVTIYSDGVRQDVGLIGMATNSIIYAFIGPLISISTTWLIAYLTSTYKKPLSKIIYQANIIIIMIPIIGSLPSALRLYSGLGLYDTWGYVVISSISFVGSNFLIFHAFFKTIANELKEAASIDGAGNFGIMMQIVFPLTIKMFGILYIMSFISRWNDYMTMLIWLPSKPTLAYGLYRLGTSTDTTGSWPPRQFAGCMILMLPILTIFLIFRNKIIGQVTMGALKG